MAKTKHIIFFFFISLLFTKAVISQSNFYATDHVREIKIYFCEGNWDHILDSLHEYIGEDGRLQGDVMIEGRMYHNIGVRYKGYSSFDPDAVKSPFNIDLEYKFNNQNYQGFTKLKLSNVIQDPSFVREVLSYEIARKYVPASFANYANVYVNDTLLGLYTNIEAIDKSFIDLRFGENNNSFFKGSPENLIIPDGQNANLAYYDTDTSSYKLYYKLESDNSETSWPDLLNLIDILNNDTANIASILNIDRALWMHAINYTLVNLDSYIGYSQNYYLYMDINGRFNPILWDFNMSFGSFKETDGISSPPGGLTISKRKTLDPLKMLTSTPISPRPLIVNLLQDPTRKRMFLAHMRTIINENFKNNQYLTRGQELQIMIDSYVQNDTNKFYPYSQFHLNLDTTVGSGNNIFPGIKDFMEARIAYLDTFPGFKGAPAISEIQHTPNIPEKGSEFWITVIISGANNAVLSYRQKSNDIFLKEIMYDDGNHNDGIEGDSIFGAKIITSGNTVQYYIYAENDSAGIFSPERAEYEFYSIQPKIKLGEIVINEFCSNWIELFNNTNEDYNVNGLYLSDDIADIAKWTFPDTIIKSKKYLVVWTDESNSSSDLRVNFNLPDIGGELFLSYNTTSIIDSIKYGEEEPGKSIGRYPNGTGAFVYMQPTFSKYNNIGTTKGLDFLLFPNPAKNKIYIEFDNEETPFSLQIINAVGQVLIKNQYNNIESSLSVISKSIDISDLNNGIYVLKIVANDRLMSRKFVIL